MNIFQAIILGIIQGATEFLPISSSGHLVLAPFLFGWELPSTDTFVFDILVQVATLIAVIAYFWNDIRQITLAVWRGLRQRQPFTEPESRLGWLLALATVPAGLAYLLFDNLFESAFGNPLATALFLLVTAVLLFLAERFSKHQREFSDITWKDALVVGIFQILALFPGISRSGATITGGMSRGLKRPVAARFSFLISLPILLAAGLIGVLKLVQIPNFIQLLPTFSAGFLSAALVGYLSIRWLLQYLSQRPLYIFAIYCTVFSLINLTLMLAR